MLSATQTRPPLRWLSYVFIYIRAKFAILFTDNYPKNINSDTHKMLISSSLTNPASATLEGKKLRCSRLPSSRFGKPDAGKTENYRITLVARQTM